MAPEWVWRLSEVQVLDLSSHQFTAAISSKVREINTTGLTDLKGAILTPMKDSLWRLRMASMSTIFLPSPLPSLTYPTTDWKEVAC